MNNISIIGSTGSIGTQALQVADILKNITISGLSANSNIDLLENQIRKYKPLKACIMNEQLYTELKNRVSDTATRVTAGIDGLCEISTIPEAEGVLTSVVGNIGLLPTVEAINAKKNILLANKETLVTAGSLIMPLAKKCGVSILPVDSEHSAIFQCLQGNKYKNISKILLTASGGPFFGRQREELIKVTKADALKHPNWSMGSKITIDSATMMNKGLEVIEAKWLFGVDVQNIEVYVHRQSIVHSMVEFCDNSVIAQLGVPDMKLPIAYAIGYPERTIAVNEPLNLFEISNLTFEKPDYETFECLTLALNAVKIGGLMPTVMNAANEIAVERFLKDEISFVDIAHIISKTMDAFDDNNNEVSINEILKADKWARNYGLKL